MSHTESGGGGEGFIVEKFKETTQSIWDLLSGIFTAGLIYFINEGHH